MRCSMRFVSLSVALLAVTAVAGCASDYPRVDANMGKSVAQMIRAQTLNPKDAAHPAARGPETGDGERLDNVLKALRKDVPKGTTQPVQAGQFEAGQQ